MFGEQGRFESRRELSEEPVTEAIVGFAYCNRNQLSYNWKFYEHTKNNKWETEKCKFCMKVKLYTIDLLKTVVLQLRA